MSKIIASAAIRGAHKIVDRAEKKWQEAMDKWGPNEPVGFPNTAYYLPIIYGILGTPVAKLGDMEQVLKRCKSLLPPPVKERTPLPYLAPALDAGMVTFWAEEMIEAIRYLEAPDFYLRGEEVGDSNIWLGAADDVIMRKRGVEFVDGTAPGFAAICGAAPTPEIAKKIAQELQEKNLYVFMCAEYNGKKFSEQLVEAGVQKYNDALTLIGNHASQQANAAVPGLSDYVDAGVTGLLVDDIAMINALIIQKQSADAGNTAISTTTRECR